MNDLYSQEHRYQGEHPISTLWFLFDQEHWRLLGALLIFIVKHSPVWLMPLLTANIIDVLVQHRPVAELWMNALILVLLLFQNIPMHVWYMRTLSISLRTMETNLRSTICRRLQQLSIGFYTQASAGVVQSKVVRDVEAVVDMVRQFFDGGLSAICNLLGAVVITAIRVPAFLPFFIVIVPISALLVSSMRNALSNRNQEFRHKIEGMASRINEMTNLIPITRAHGLEENEVERIDAALLQVRQSGLELDVVNAVFGSLSWATYNVFNVVCLVAAVWVSYTGWIAISAGDVVMLTGYFNSLTSAVMLLVNLIPLISKGFESIRSIGEVLESPDLEQNEGKTRMERVKGEVRFEKVSFTYPDAEKAAIDDFSLNVHRGENIALVGHSGAGKSTILNLVIGFIRPTSGRILLDGLDMNSLDLRTYRRFISMVPQETILFEGTVRENITFGLESFNDDLVEQALRDANAWEFVQQLPLGVQTHVGERGAKLSGGQKQRLAIARAIIRNPRVLILDEATSSLDTEAEALIQDALARLMKDRTTFIVAHRLSTIRNANRIVVIENGRMVETGTHAELMGYASLYSHLQARQNIDSVE